jgi:hypothetical protein
MIQSGENYNMIWTRTARIEYWYGTTRRTVRYDTIRTASDRPTIQYIHVRRTTHSTYDRGSYCISSGSTVRYNTNRENAVCKPRYFIYDPRDFLLRPEVFHDPIRGLYCVSLGRNRIVLQILMSQTDHAPIRTRYDMILTYGTGCNI